MTTQSKKKYTAKDNVRIRGTVSIIWQQLEVAKALLTSTLNSSGHEAEYFYSTPRGAISPCELLTEQIDLAMRALEQLQSRRAAYSRTART